MIYIRKTHIILASETVPSTSCALFDIPWSRLEIWGMQAGADIGYGLASMPNPLNSESVKTHAHNT